MYWIEEKVRPAFCKTMDPAATICGYFWYCLYDLLAFEGL